MKVALINPRSEGTKVRPYLKRMTTFFRVTLPVLAAYTPDEVELDVFDENVELIPFDKGYDVVGLTVLTSGFNRAVEISNRFRAKGTKVVWGGIHPTVCPKESKQFADSIVVGEGELAWSQLLKDYQVGELKLLYAGQPAEERKLPKRSVLNGKSLLTFEAVETSRGCPNSCEHCIVPVINNGRIRNFSLESVVEDIKSTRGTHLFFVDDNLIGNPEFAKKLFERMRCLRKKWLCQAPVYIADDNEMLRLASESGCIGLYLGVKSILSNCLDEVGKRRNVTERYRTQLQKIHDCGIGVEAGFIFGFDGDTPEVFERTLEFLDQTKVDSPNFHILTPYPGTRLFQRLEREGRILHRDWSRYNTGNVVHIPRNLTPETLAEGFEWIHKQAYSLPRITKRVLGSNHPFYTAVVNLTTKIGR